MLTKEHIERGNYYTQISEDTFKQGVLAPRAWLEEIQQQAILAISLKAELAAYKAKLDKIRAWIKAHQKAAHDRNQQISGDTTLWTAKQFDYVVENLLSMLDESEAEQ